MKKVQSFILKSLQKDQDDFFEDFTRRFDEYFDYLTSGTSKRVDRERQKGLAFEELTYQLIKAGAFPQLNIYKVWRFEDFPMKQDFSLGTRDNGIDIIIQTKDGHYSPVQVKYRKKPKKSSITINKTNLSHNISDMRTNNSTYQKRLYWSVPWRDFSTFHSLCERSGPSSGWHKRIIITNAPSISWKGRKLSHDLSICRGSWKKINKHLFSEALGMSGNVLNTDKKTVENKTIEEKRIERLARFNL